MKKPAESDSISTVVASINIALEQGEDRKAVQLIAEAVESHLLPRAGALLPLLARHLGQFMASRVIHTFATYPCFYCDKGLNPCEACSGTAWNEDGSACEECLGLGHAFCDFCKGSGWVTIDFVPAGLRLPVLIERLELADKRLRGALGPMERPDTKTLSARLVALNQVLAVLENTVLAVKESLPHDRETGATGEKIIQACAGDGRKAHKALMHVLEAMRHHALAKAQQSSGIHAEHAQQRAMLYEGILARFLVGTRLGHPFIQEVMLETAGPQKGD